MTQLVLAQETGAGSLTSIIFLVLLVGVFWLFIIRPQRQRSKAQQALADSLATGQEVRTIGGIHGKVVSVDEDSVVLEVEQGRIRVSRRAIGSRVGDGKT